MKIQLADSDKGEFLPAHGGTRRTTDSKRERGKGSRDWDVTK